MRVVAGTAFAWISALLLHSGPSSGPAAPVASLFAGVAALGLLVGLWTPLAGSLAAMVGIWLAVMHPEDALASVLLATIGAALALVGPGAWSIDARLFGWKRIDLRDRRK